jgi:hypothetical protein
MLISCERPPFLLRRPTHQGRIQDFKLGGRAEGGANIFGVFRMKNHDCSQNLHIRCESLHNLHFKTFYFSILRVSLDLGANSTIDRALSALRARIIGVYNSLQSMFVQSLKMIYRHEFLLEFFFIC